MQIGTGVNTISITNDWAQGTINPTGVSSNLAINGNGFFVVQDPSSTAQYATQDGTFTLNNNGNLVTSNGMLVQGYSNTGLSTLGPIVINTQGMPSTSSPTATMTSYSISSSGTITVNLSDGTSFVRGQILLQNFQNPQALVNQGSNLYSNMTNAGPLTALTAPDRAAWAPSNPAPWNYPTSISPPRWLI